MFRFADAAAYLVTTKKSIRSISDIKRIDNILSEKII